MSLILILGVLGGLLAVSAVVVVLLVVLLSNRSKGRNAPDEE